MSEEQASGLLQNAVTKTHIMWQLRFIVPCGITHFLCAMCVFEVRASSSSLRLPLRQISFLVLPPLLRKPTEKSRVLNESLTQLI